MVGVEDDREQLEETGRLGRKNVRVRKGQWTDEGQVKEMENLLWRAGHGMHSRAMENTGHNVVSPDSAGDPSSRALWRRHTRPATKIGLSS